MTKIHGLLLVGCSAVALAGCGANDIASPGAGGITINNPAPTPAPTPSPTPSSSAVVAADSCPDTGGVTLTNDGVITSPEGTWRVCTLPKVIDKSSALPKKAGVLYRIHGRVDVGCDGGFRAPTAAKPETVTTVNCINKGITKLTADTNVTLTIDPGVILYGEADSQPAWLAVNRGNKIQATGTAAHPIIFTSIENVVDDPKRHVTDTSQGLWGGVVLLGRGMVTDCTVAGTVATGDPATQTCERDTEGSVDPAVFGGNNNADSSGTMKFFQIRYSGFALSPGKELQSLTGGGVGSGTQLEYFQSLNSSDDGSEWFGGAVHFKHYVAVGADDDSLDLDTGLQGLFQYVLNIQRPDGGDALFEIDSNGSETDKPRQKTTIANFTAIQPGNNSGNSDLSGIMLRGNADINFVNGIEVTRNNACFTISNNAAAASDGPTFTANSFVMSCAASGAFVNTSGSKTTAAQAESTFNAGSNNNSNLTSTLTGLFIPGTNESAVPAYADITTISSFFDKPTYIGAVKDASDTWYRGWTCDSSLANFGSGSDCTALPTT